ncbi:MAG: acetate kinase [Clostridia bacterium]|nr:acetate kinase [Clostridia bacterium]
MKILVVNAGSSSLKYQLIDMTDEKVIAKGLCERIGIDGKISHKTFDGREYEAQIDMPDHTAAFKCVEKALISGDAKAIDSMDEIGAVGHRIVQGGAIFDHSVLVNEQVVNDIEGLADLAPLHNIAHVQGIRGCLECFGDKIPQVVVFDTSFHATMPETSYLFALPYEYYEKYKIRRYGFHGTSHRYVSARCLELLNMKKEGSKIITCHLGNGSSITAVKDGKCFDTSMGLTPLDGFMMGTRTGTLDPSVLTYIIEKEGLSAKELSDLCNKKSGVLGVSGVSSDNRDVEAAAAEGNERAKLALEMQRYQIRKFVGSYIAAMNGVDAIVFTGGIGENSAELRKSVCDNLAFMGVKIDDSINDTLRRGAEGVFSTEDSTVKVMVIPTNEELVIARDTKEIVENM